jgi:hypothetical protein
VALHGIMRNDVASGREVFFNYEESPQEITQDRTSPHAPLNSFDETEEGFVGSSQGISSSASPL